MQRNSSIDDLDIQVDVAGNKVTLRGTVDSFYAKDEAEQIAWNAPGVWTVDNELVIEYDN
ncbi:BON domain-containing protein [Mucilaginibacter antarcticus]|uniref:BON domain-containing protein n=1 Tax=Mucilaginibacter antarcticus TaxID=1855725 RepID=UPI00363D825E